MRDGEAAARTVRRTLRGSLKRRWVGGLGRKQLGDFCILFGSEILSGKGVVSVIQMDCVVKGVGELLRSPATGSNQSPGCRISWSGGGDGLGLCTLPDT